MLHGDPGFDPGEGVHKSAGLIWDVATLTWIKDTGGGSATTLTVSGTVTTTPSGITSVTAGVLSTLAAQAGAWVVNVVPAGSFTNSTQTVTLGVSTVQAQQAGAWVVNAVPAGSFTNSTQTVTVGTVTANPQTAFGKTLTYIAVSQGAAGTTALISASTNNFHKLMGCCLVMDAAGTLKFSDGTVDLTGAMSIATNGGFVLSTGFVPYLSTFAVTRPLNIVTATGAVKGFVTILTEP